MPRETIKLSSLVSENIAATFKSAKISESFLRGPTS